MYIALFAFRWRKHNFNKKSFLYLPVIKIHLVGLSILKPLLHRRKKAGEKEKHWRELMISGEESSWSCRKVDCCKSTE